MDDAFYFLTQDQMDLSIFSNLLNYLSREKDYVAWYPVLKGYEYVSGYFPYTESTLIKEKILIPLDKAFLSMLRGLNITVNNHIDDSLKQEISKWACMFGSLYCRNVSNGVLRSEIRSSVPSVWKDWVYCKGLIGADLETWNQLFEIFLNGTNNEMLRYLACSERSEIIIGYMDKITNNTEIRNIIANKGMKTSINIFHSIIQRHSKTILVIEYILNNFNYVIPRQIGTLVALIDIINHICLREPLAKVMDFVVLHKHHLPAYLMVNIKLTKRMEQIRSQEERFSNFKRMEEMT